MVLVRGILMDHGQRAILAARIEHIPGDGIEVGSVDARSDGKCGDDLARVGVDHGHHVVAAADEQAAVLGIESHAGRLFTRCQGKTPGDRHLL